MRDGTVTVAKLPVIKAFETGMRIVIRNCESIDEPVGGLNRFAQKFVKAIFINTLTGNGTAKTAQTSATKRKFSQVYHPALIRRRSTKVGDHSRKISIVIRAVGYDNHILGLILGDGKNVGRYI